MTFTTAIYHDPEDPQFRLHLKGTAKFLQDQFDGAGILARVTWTPHACAAHFDNRQSMLAGSEKMIAIPGVQPRQVHRFAEGGDETFVITFNFRPDYLRVR